MRLALFLSSSKKLEGGAFDGALVGAFLVGGGGGRGGRGGSSGGGGGREGGVTVKKTRARAQAGG